MMKVGIDTQSICGCKTGIGYYTGGLIKQFTGVLEANFYYYKITTTKDFNTIQRIYWENITLPKFAAKDSLDILHIPGFAGPRFSDSYKKVTTVHDLIGIIYPQNLAPISRFYWQRWLPACIRKSDFILVDSENSKRDIMKFLKISDKKIQVVYLAADTKFKPIDRSDSRTAILNSYGIDKNYILSVGTIEPRKNLVNLIIAFSKYLKESKRKDLQLVIAGKKGWDYQRCYQKIKELGIKDKVVFCGYVKDEILPLLYNFADVFVYPCFYEGFGLPVLEAISCGTAVICSNTSSLPEIAGNAAVFIDPKSVNSIRNALTDVLQNQELKTALSRKAIIQSKKFSWEKTASETIKVYKEILS